MAIEKLNLRADSQDERFAQLKQLYPEIFSDGNLNVDALKEACGLETEEDGYYGLYWPGKNEAKRLARKEATGTLEPVEGDGVNEETTHNIYIEGDNLEVLRTLKKSYQNRVKMIYIDPPYNTGNDFIYPDNYSEPVEDYLRFTGQMDDKGNLLVANTKSSGRYHRNWLNMIYPRLKLAKELLSEDGVIFISIDDNEQANLKLLLDEIFGEENLLVNAIWVNGRTAAAHFTKSHEYVIGYAKDIESLPFFKYRGPKQYITDRTTKRISSKNPACEISFPSGIDFLGEDKVFPKEFGDTEKIYITEGVMECKNHKLASPIKIKAGWAMKDMIESWINGREVIDQKGQKVTRFFFKENGVLQYEKVKSTIHPNSVISNISTKSGSSLLDSLNMENLFPYPKPIELMEYLSDVMNEGDIILDFFSGSASTAHAVMQLNKEDNGNRKFIMVQLPQKCEENSEAAKAGYQNICEIGKERIRRAGAKILEEAKANKDMFTKDNPLDLGFKVYRLAKSNFTVFENISGTDKSALDTLFSAAEKEPLTEGWKERKSSVITELCLRHGFVLDSAITKCPEYTKNEVLKVVDQDQEKTMFVCLDEKISGETAKNLHLEDGEKFICLDSAIGDQLKVQLADKGRIETI